MATKQKILKCIHGLIWNTCGVCSSKTKAEVNAELKRVKASMDSSLQYDYQDVVEVSENDADLDFDLEDGSMS